MNFSSSLDAISHYEAKLAALEQASPHPSAELVLNVLIIRDAIATTLTDLSSIPTEHLVTLADLDERLKLQGEVIAQQVNLDQWRKSFNSAQDRWWWYFERREATHPWNRFNWLWTAVSVTCLTIALSLVGDVSSRFVTGGPDTLGALAISTQSVLTLLAGGSALTKAGREANQRVLSSLNIPNYYWHEISAGFSLLVLAGLVSFRFSLPWVATFYNTWGNESFEKGELMSAQYSYERALALNPAYLEPHHWLGVLYEDLNQFDNARTEYEIAAQGGFVLSSINLARLYIVNGEPSKAIAQLIRAEDHLSNLTRNPGDRYQRLIALAGSVELVQYFLLRTQGWARVAQEDYGRATAHLEQAFELGETLLKDAQDHNQTNLVNRLLRTQSGIQCLLAQSSEASGNMDLAILQWRGCIAYANEEELGHDEWIRMARQRLDSDLNQ
ncbi:MAG: tetratricopeptide repeat protein [Elainellaceae cyanobacterium]